MKKVKKNKFDKIVCRLSEPQLGVYLDEKVHDKDNAYSVPGIFNCGGDYSVDEIKSAIVALIEKHPILKGRVLETEDFPFLVCDSFPEIVEMITANLITQNPYYYFYPVFHYGLNIDILDL